VQTDRAWTGTISRRSRTASLPGLAYQVALVSCQRAIEHSATPAEPVEAFGLARRLMERYLGWLHLELAYHNHLLEKLVNRGLVAIAHRMDLPVVATGGVRFALPEDALAHQLL
jgi:DNA polymerase III alpha subunit